MKIMTYVLIALATAGCADTTTTEDGEAASPTSKNDGCPPGEQPVFGPGGALVCSTIPVWPPADSGSRQAAARCSLRDGDYLSTWPIDTSNGARPPFMWHRFLTIAGEVMTIGDYYLGNNEIHYEEYEYDLDWVDAETANAWAPGDTDTWEFVVWLDCDAGLVRGTWTFNPPYPDPSHATVTLTFTAVPDLGGRQMTTLNPSDS